MYVMKTFRTNKSASKIYDEVQLQRKCSDVGISPKIVDFDTERKFIVMEKMDGHLIELVKTLEGKLPEKYQLQIINIFKQLDKVKVFQGDANLMNYMIRGGKVYIIDFGYAKLIDTKQVKKLGTERPNMTLMLTGFILKLKDLKCDPSSYMILKQYVSPETIKQYGI